MTSLLIAYPDIPYRALTATTFASNDGVIASSAHDANKYALENTIAGPRHTWHALNTAAKQFSVLYDMGAGVSASANYFIVTRADILPADTVELGYATTAGAYTLAVEEYPWWWGERLGTRATDYVTTFASVSGRYWLTNFVKDSTTVFPRQKVYIGTWLDLGRDPSDVDASRAVTRGDTYRSDTGNAISARMGEPVYTASITWDGLTDAAVLSFKQKLCLYPIQRTCFLYTSSNHVVLDNIKLLHCELVEASFTKVYSNYNSITARFVEVVG